MNFYSLMTRRYALRWWQMNYASLLWKTRHVAITMQKNLHFDPMPKTWLTIHSHHYYSLPFVVSSAAFHHLCPNPHQHHHYHHHCHYHTVIIRQYHNSEHHSYSMIFVHLTLFVDVVVLAFRLPLQCANLIPFYYYLWMNHALLLPPFHFLRRHAVQLQMNYVLLLWMRHVATIMQKNLHCDLMQMTWPTIHSHHYSFFAAVAVASLHQQQ
mmetsp:Transcript_10135/g.20390  ORF Transcript_10135/g.20390 Transcript_10135/m.20390 type:complete len:211 (-) Transcript_10135:421-1053(-)